MDIKPEAHETIGNDLVKPIMAAAWVGLVMTMVEGEFSKRNRLVVFTLIVVGGFAYMTWARSRDLD